MQQIRLFLNNYTDHNDLDYVDIQLSVSVAMNELPEIHALFDEHGWSYVMPEWGEIDETQELWSTADGVEVVEDDDMLETITKARADNNLPELSKDLIGMYTRYTHECPRVVIKYL